MKKIKIKNFRKNLQEFKILERNVIRSLKEFFRISPKIFFLILITRTFIAILPFAQAYVYAKLIDYIVQVITGDTIMNNQLMYLIIFSLSISLFIQLFFKIDELAERMAYQRWHVHSAYVVHKATSELDMEIYESNQYNKFLNKIRSGYDWQPPNFIMSSFDFLQALIQVISAIAIMIALAPILIPLLLISLIPEFNIKLASAKKIWIIWDLKGDEKIRFYGTAQYLNRERYIKELKIFKSAKHLLKTLRKVTKTFVEEQNKVIKKEFRDSTIAKILNFSIEASIQVWLIFKVIKDASFSIGDYTFFWRTILNFSESSRNLFRHLSRLYERNLYMKEYYKLMDMEPKIKSKENALKIGTEKIPMIEFKDVSFTYPESKEKIFDNFSLKINPGEDIALVGENGAGKTTLVKLLARLYDIDKGQILINGIDLRDLDLDSWYENLGILFQDFNKYAYSVEENIALGRISDFKNTEKILKSSKDAGAHEFVKDYDLQYQKMLSKEYKNGIELSGGQWQKIALARAFFRNSNILILDEPTSAIDAKAEYEIFKRVEDMQKEKTTIIISHRFSTVKKAQKIYVIKKGKIIEQGSHKDLMKIQEGKYREMFTLQAEAYVN
jgi:ABC-type multidrug transport system fused ATPase/permease subunit